jgi:hypothetical protein
LVIIIIIINNNNNSATTSPALTSAGRESPECPGGAATREFDIRAASTHARQPLPGDAARGAQRGGRRPLVVARDSRRVPSSQ